MSTTTRIHDIARFAPHGVISSARLRATGMASSTIAGRCLPGGPWRWLYPGVVMLSTGEPTRRQLVQAAAEHAGPAAIITGTDALRAHGLHTPSTRAVHVLVPASRRPVPPAWVVMERTRRPPKVTPIDGLPCAPPVRAVLDAARREYDPDRLRGLLGITVYYGLCTVDQLRLELDTGNQRGSAAVRMTLRKFAAGHETFVHGLARRLAIRAPLPPPRWNVDVRGLGGEPVGTVDAWWDEVGLAWLLGGQGADEKCRLALAARGVVTLRTSAERLRQDAPSVLTELVSAFRDAARRRRPRVMATSDVAAA